MLKQEVKQEIQLWWSDAQQMQDMVQALVAQVRENEIAKEKEK